MISVLETQSHSSWIFYVMCQTCSNRNASWQWCGLCYPSRTFYSPQQPPERTGVQACESPRAFLFSSTSVSRWEDTVSQGHMSSLISSHWTLTATPLKNPTDNKSPLWGWGTCCGSLHWFSAVFIHHVWRKQCAPCDTSHLPRKTWTRSIKPKNATVSPSSFHFNSVFTVFFANRVLSKLWVTF